MEMKMGDWERKNIVNELTRGKDLARQLQMHLNNNNRPSSSSQLETREYLVQKILVSYEKALSMLNCTSSTTAGDQYHQPQPHTQPQPQPSPGVSGLIMSESPPSLNGSPRSEDSDRDQEHRDHASWKRKSLPRWTQQVRVNPGMGLEGPLDDGFSWRKYGQKDILGAKYPRGYYRCTHRNVQGCLATKQVQRSDEDPNIFEITYRGRHTCTQASHVPAPIIASPDHQNQDQVPPIDQLPHDQLQQNNNNNIMITNQQQVTLQDHHHHIEDHVLSNFRSGLKVITEGLDNRDDHQPSSFFPGHSANFGTNSMMVSGFSPPTFVSPATSGTNYFPVSQGGNINNYDHNAQFGLLQQQQQQQQQFHHDSELGGIISAATSSATNTPTTVGNLDFPFGHHQDHGAGGDQFDSNFMFGNSGFF